MDLLAALALVLVLEGLAIVVFARSLPELLAEMQGMDSTRLRQMGLIAIGIGAIGYLAVRGGL